MWWCMWPSKNTRPPLDLMPDKKVLGSSPFLGPFCVEMHIFPMSAWFLPSTPPTVQKHAWIEVKWCRQHKVYTLSQDHFTSVTRGQCEHGGTLKLWCSLENVSQAVWCSAVSTGPTKGHWELILPLWSLFQSVQSETRTREGHWRSFRRSLVVLILFHLAQRS